MNRLRNGTMFFHKAKFVRLLLFGLPLTAWCEDQRPNVVLSGLDWLPAVCRIAGSDKVPDSLDGEDVGSAFFGKERRRETPLFWRTTAPNSGSALLKGDWKLHMGGKRRPKVELDNLSVDPSESRNVAAQNPRVVEELKKQIESRVKELPSAYRKLEKAGLNETKRKGKRSNPKN